MPSLLDWESRRGGLREPVGIQREIIVRDIARHPLEKVPVSREAEITSVDKVE